MPLTLEEILNLEQDLRQEIAAKQRLLGAYETFRAEMGSGGSFPPAPVAAAAALATPDTSPAQPAPPPVAQPPRYVNPELEKLKTCNHGNGDLVRWAIQRMTRDYCGRDVSDLLWKEGAPLGSAEVSVVLTRIKRRGEIEQIRPGNGRIGALFRRPDNPLPVRKDTPEQTDDTEEITQPSAIS